MRRNGARDAAACWAICPHVLSQHHVTNLGSHSKHVAGERSFDVSHRTSGSRRSGDTPTGCARACRQTVTRSSSRQHIHTAKETLTLRATQHITAFLCSAVLGCRRLTRHVHTGRHTQSRLILRINTSAPIHHSHAVERATSAARQRRHTHALRAGAAAKQNKEQPGRCGSESQSKCCCNWVREFAKQGAAAHACIHTCTRTHASMRAAPSALQPLCTRPAGGARRRTRVSSGTCCRRARRKQPWLIDKETQRAHARAHTKHVMTDAQQHTRYAAQGTHKPRTRAHARLAQHSKMCEHSPGNATHVRPPLLGRRLQRRQQATSEACRCQRAACQHVAFDAVIQCTQQMQHLGRARRATPARPVLARHHPQASHHGTLGIPAIPIHAARAWDTPAGWQHMHRQLVPPSGIRCNRNPNQHQEC